jgi:transposase
MKSRAYRRSDVKLLDRELLVESAAKKGAGVVAVGLDIAKDEIVAVLRWSDGEVERPWSLRNPTEIDELVDIVRRLKKVGQQVLVGMESTGTYGEAVRRALTLASIEVHRVSGKAVCDYTEVYDGVPSQHDGKDAAVIAELTAFGKGVAWPFEEESEFIGELRHRMNRLDAFRVQLTQWEGRLEALLGAHWPELTKLLELESVTLLSMLEHYGGPSAVAADGQASARLRGWGGSMLSKAKIQQVIESAQTTAGVPMRQSEVQWLREVAREALSAFRQIGSCEKELKRLMVGDKFFKDYVQDVGAGTLAAILTTVGDPRKYDSAGAFLKALGLNLKERSSGRRKGELAITKRGPSRARRWLFYWSLRGVQREELKDWYAEFIQVGGGRSAGKQEHRKMKGVIALMRKQCRGLWHAMKHGEELEYGKLLGPTKGQRRRSRRSVKRAERRSSQAAATVSG